MDAGKHKTFSLEHPRHLLEKLRWEVSELDQTPGFALEIKAYWALNCATTAWHMCDWLFAECKNDARVMQEMLKLTGRKQIRDLSDVQDWARGERTISICRQLATAAKHFEVQTHPDAKVKAILDVEVEHAANGSADLFVRLVIRDGDESVAPHVLFWKAHQFWRRVLEELDILQPPEPI